MHTLFFERAAPVWCKELNDMFKNILLWIVIAVVLMSVFNNFGPRGEQKDSALSYSQFIDAVKSGQVQEVILDDESGIKGNKVVNQ